MESLGPTPPKVRRVFKSAPNMHLSECVRQFKLPQQFPSTVAGHKPVAKEHKLTSPNTLEIQPQNITLSGKNQLLLNKEKNSKNNTESSEPISSQKILTSSKSSSILTSGLNQNQKTTPSAFTANTDSSKLKTLKLKSPDGKDLGEFQVTVVSEKTSLLKRKSLPATKDVSSKDETQENTVSNTQGETVVSYSIKDVQYPGAIYQEPRIERVGQDQNNKIKIISNVSLNRKSNNAEIIQGKQMIKKIFENTRFETVSSPKVNNPWIKMDTNKVIFSKNDSQLGTQKLLYLKPDEHPFLKNITKSGKPISLKPVKLKSLNLQEKSNALAEALTGYKNGDMDEDLKNEIHSKTPQKIVSLPSTSNSKKTMVMLPNSPEKEKTQEISSPSSSEIGTLEDSDDDERFRNLNSDEDELELLVQKTVKLPEPKKKNTETKKIKENLTQKNIEPDFFEKNSTLDISIVERALASVKDKNLREEALKVLATCKLGAERQIPIRPPTDTISVRETATQTNVFGNLERGIEEFIEVNEYDRKIKRIEKKMRDSSVFYTSFNSAPPKEIDTNFTEELDTILDKMNLHTTTKEKVQNIKTVLERPIQSTEKIILIQKQMVEDIKMLKTYDENGLTGLHRAVKRDDVRTVKRLLVMMRVTKDDVDMRTDDNKTSLELALKCDADPEIVNALLEAGAKPTSGETGYESALMIASRNSSPLLSLLTKYANKKDFDCIDSEGFAAIHNCASRGNLVGVNALVTAGANVNLQDQRSGRTALFHAIENNHTETARQLLSLGAKPQIRNNDGQSILPLIDDPRNQVLKNIVNKSMKTSNTT